MSKLFEMWLLWLESKWDKTNRRTDMRCLWPVLLEHYGADRDCARAAMYRHMIEDPCWSKHYTKQELLAFVEAL